MKMPALVIAVMLLFTGCATGEPVDAAPQCNTRQEAVEYIEYVREDMATKGLEDSAEFKAFEKSYWESFEEAHTWCEICYPEGE